VFESRSGPSSVLFYEENVTSHGLIDFVRSISLVVIRIWKISVIQEAGSNNIKEKKALCNWIRKERHLTIFRSCDVLSLLWVISAEDTVPPPVSE